MTVIAAKVMAWAPFGHAVAIQKSSTAPIQRWARSWCASRQDTHCDYQRWGSGALDFKR